MHFPTGFQIFAFLLHIVLIAATKTSETEKNGRLGYECGERFFPNPKIADALFVAAYAIRTNFNPPQLYRGNLYSEDEKYMTWPIEDKSLLQQGLEAASPYQVIFNAQFHIIDVVVLMKNNHFMKCSKLDGTAATPPYPAPWEGDGYTCGHQFFHETKLHEIIASSGLKPIKYPGSLYQPEVYAKMLPMEISFPGREKENQNPYRVVIDKEKNLLGVLAETVDSNLVKCQRSWSPEAVRSGYQCDKIFFEKKFLEESVNAARQTSRLSNHYPYPKVFQLAPRKNLLSWPLSNDRMLSRKIEVWPYWILMRNNLDMIYPFMLKSGVHEMCEERTIEPEKYYNEKALDCGGKIFWEEQLNRSARLGCQSNLSMYWKVGRRTRKYLSEYMEQMNHSDLLVSSPTKYYVMYNSDCQFVRAIYRPSPISGLVSCKKVHRTGPTSNLRKRILGLKFSKHM